MVAGLTVSLAMGVVFELEHDEEVEVGTLVEAAHHPGGVRIPGIVIVLLRKKVGQGPRKKTYVE